MRSRHVQSASIVFVVVFLNSYHGVKCPVVDIVSLSSRLLCVHRLSVHEVAFPPNVATGALVLAQSAYSWVHACCIT